MLNYVTYVKLCLPMLKKVAENEIRYSRSPRSIYYFLQFISLLHRSTSYALHSLNGLPSALEQNGPDSFPQQCQSFPQRCGNGVLSRKSPKKGENAQEISSL